MPQSRALGFWETFKAITHDACHGFETISITTAFRGVMKPALFRQALAFTYGRHPLLQATIEKKDAVYYYVFKNDFSAIPLSFSQGANPEVWQQTVYQASNCSVQPEHYLWRVDVFYEDERVFFTLSIHHAPSDGRSLMTLVDDILYAYSCYLEGEQPARPCLPLLPPTEHLAAESLSLPVYLQQREQLLAATIAKSSSLSLGPQKELVGLAQRTTHTVYKELNEEQTASIQAFCRAHQLSINSLLNALLLKSAQELHVASLSVAMLTPVHTKPAIDKAQVGCHVSLITTLYEGLDASSTVLALGQEYQAKFKRELPRQLHLPKRFQLDDVARAFALDCDLDCYKYLLVVSNLGESLVQRRYNHQEVERIEVGVNNRAGAVACVLLTYLVHNKIQLGFVYTQPLVSAAYIEELTLYFMHSLMRLFSPSSA